MAGEDGLVQRRQPQESARQDSGSNLTTGRRCSKRKQSGSAIWAELSRARAEAAPEGSLIINTATPVFP